MTQECETRRALCGISRNEIAIRHASGRASRAHVRKESYSFAPPPPQRRSRPIREIRALAAPPSPPRRHRAAKLSCCRNFDLIFRLGRDDDDGAAVHSHMRCGRQPQQSLVGTPIHQGPRITFGPRPSWQLITASSLNKSGRNLGPDRRPVIGPCFVSRVIFALHLRRRNSLSPRTNLTSNVAILWCCMTAARPLDCRRRWNDGSGNQERVPSFVRTPPKRSSFV